MKSAPPKIAPENSRFAAIILAATLAGGGAVVFFFNPATHTFYPVCQFHRLTGLNCPGCGMTRALYALLHAEFFRALRDNALFILALAMLTVRAARFRWNTFRGRTNSEFFPVKFLWPLLVVAVAFTVLRNLPMFAFLSP
jgi:hypothetical protein